MEIVKCMQRRLTSKWTRVAVIVVVVAVVAVVATGCCLKLVDMHAKEKERLAHTTADRAIQMITQAVINKDFTLPLDLTFYTRTTYALSWRVQALKMILPVPIRLDPSRPLDADEMDEVRKHGGYYFGERSTGGPRIAKFVASVLPSDASRLKMGQIPKETIVLVEVTHFSKDWMLPGDVDVEVLRRAGEEPVPDPIGSENGPFFSVVFADGEIWRLSKSIPASVLLKFVLVEQEKGLSRDIELRDYRTDRQ